MYPVSHVYSSISFIAMNGYVTQLRLIKYEVLGGDFR
jgi:hypothetical protein